METKGGMVSHDLLSKERQQTRVDYEYLHDDSKNVKPSSDDNPVNKQIYSKYYYVSLVYKVNILMNEKEKNKETPQIYDQLQSGMNGVAKPGFEKHMALKSIWKVT